MLRNIYSYLFTNFYRNLEVSLLGTRNCLIRISVLRKPKENI